MAPPTFWRRRSQRPPPPQSPPHLDQRSDQDDESQQPRGLSTASSNATIRALPAEVTLQGLEDDGIGWRQRIFRAKDKDAKNALYYIALTVFLLGAQMAWSLELSYGTPYLLDLGLSPQATSLVWLAGPLSGLIAQPVVGSLSDASASRFRRRYYMLFSTLFIFLSTFILAFAQPLSEGLVDYFGFGLGDWDPTRQSYVEVMTRFLAVASFWVLDFALNGLQASGRALVLDSLRGEEMDTGNAWLGRMTHIGNILGYSAGYLDLSRLRSLRWLGGDQFRKFAFIALLGMVIAVAITCVCIEEETTETSTFSSANMLHKPTPSAATRFKTMTRDIWDSIRRLPRPIRRVCIVQIFAFMGWFPFLFYSTTWIATFEERGSSQKLVERRERKGTQGMLLFAVLSLIFGTLLPLLSLGNMRIANPHSPKARLRAALLKASSFVGGTALRKGIALRTFWTIACVLYALMMALTFIATTTTQAIILVGAVGISWAISAWVPFALVMAFIKEAEQGGTPFEFPEDYYSPLRTAERRRRASSRISGPDALVADPDEVDGTEQERESSTARRQLREALGECKPLRGQRSGSVNSGSTIRTRGGGRSRGGGSRIGSGSYIARGSEVLREQVPSGTRRARSASRRSSFLSHEVERMKDSDDDDDEDTAEGGGANRSGRTSGQGTPRRSRSGDREVLLEEDEEAEDLPEDSRKGGTILGIHNLAIVIPQFFVSIVSSLIFAHFNHSSTSSLAISSTLGAQAAATAEHGRGDGSAPGVAWVLRFGGLAACFAALLTRLVPRTQRERDRLREESEVDEEEDEVGPLLGDVPE